MHDPIDHATHAAWPRSGQDLALALRRRFPSDDWLGALAKAAIKPRGDIEQALQLDADVPSDIHAALAQIGQAMDIGDSGKKDDVFRASTNDADAAMEVDSEAGLTVQPAEKPMPSRSGSEHEIRSKEPKAAKNAEFLPFSGMPQALAPLHEKKPRT